MTALIAIDWGTSSFRAWALDREGGVIATSRAGTGILQVPGRDFDAALEVALAGLPPSDAPVILSGMITSRNGWIETPYLSLPLGLGELASGLVAARSRAGRALHFLCGVQRDGAAPDVMRGEEAEIAGLLAGGLREGLVILPGTHSKLAQLEAGRMTGFQTCMTGEVYAVLTAHSILGRLMAAPAGAATAPGPAFRRGLAAAALPGPLLSRIFTARSLALFDRLAPEGIGDYLSGLLIGDELIGGLTGPPGAVTLVGRGDLTERYRIAVESLGWTVRLTEEGAARRGLFAIAQQAGVLQ